MSRISNLLVERRKKHEFPRELRSVSAWGIIPPRLNVTHQSAIRPSSSRFVTIAFAAVVLSATRAMVELTAVVFNATRAITALTAVTMASACALVVYPKALVVDVAAVVVTVVIAAVVTVEMAAVVTDATFAG